MSDPIVRPGRIAQRGRFRQRARKMFANAMAHNIASLARSTQAATRHGDTVCDIGCWDGEAFLGYAPKGAHLTGVERYEPAVELARSRGIDALVGDINMAWPLADGSVDVLTSNQVIEHVADTDHFVSECLRVLRPGGTALVSTENLASWHNIGALVLGWQPFSITNVSTARASIGNPLSNLRHAENLSVGWQHIRVFGHRGLVELFEAHGFAGARVQGSGYYPLPARVGAWDPRHAAFITVVARKPQGLPHIRTKCAPDLQQLAGHATNCRAFETVAHRISSSWPAGISRGTSGARPPRGSRPA